MLPPVTRDPIGLSGQVLHDQFRVDDLVEDGKRSVLYRGHHLMLEVPIAIKCMKAPPGDAVETFIRRFRHESRLHYKLAQGSPHIVRVLASGTAVAPASGGLCPFMVLEWLKGCSLAQDFRDRRAKSMQGRSLGEAIRLLDPAIEALAFAHACGIVHREVTPDNLFLATTPDGQRIKVLDFGVAKILSEKALDLPPASQSMGLSPVGSPAYAAPEQFSEGIGPVGPWTDVYAIVMVLLEALRDRVVMEDDGGPMALRVMDPSRRPTPRALGLDVGEAVDVVISQALAVQPQERPQDIGLFWGMLKNAAQRDVAGAASPARRAVPPAPDAFTTNTPMTNTPMTDPPMMDPPTTPYVAGLAGARPERISEVPTVQAPPVMQARSPLANSVGSGAEGSPETLPRYADTSDSSPPSSVGDPTLVMRIEQVEDIQRMNNLDVDAEPLTRGAELFVTDDQPTQMYREETLAAAGITPGSWNVDEQLATKISAGAVRPMPVPETAPMTAKPQPHAHAHVPAQQPGHHQPPPEFPPGPPVFPPGPPVFPPGPPVHPAAQAAQAAYAAQAEHHPFVVLPTHGTAPGQPVATIPPQGQHAQGAINYATPPAAKAGASIALLLIGVFVVVGLLAAAGVYAMGTL
jgi:serine/threonine protein kinase